MQKGFNIVRQAISPLSGAVLNMNYAYMKPIITVKCNYIFVA